jgi:hypothetical protein
MIRARFEADALSVHFVPIRPDDTGQGPPVVGPRAARALRFLAAALLTLWMACAPTPALAASVLSDGSVTPTSGTTATVFTFSVHYTSTGSPVQPAQSVSAQVGNVTVTLLRVIGSANNGTWQGTSTLPAGTWDVTFHASTYSDPQPASLLGQKVTVSGPPAPTPSPTPTPQPTASAAPTATPAPTATTTPQPTGAPTARPTNRPIPLPQPTPQATDNDDPTDAPPTPTASGSARPTTPAPTPTGTAEEDDSPTATLEPSEPAADAAPPPPGSMLATLLIVGGTMSLAGAIVLARQWLVSHPVRPH